MKKIISFTMSLLLLLSFAFAANNETGSDDSIDISATMLDSKVPPKLPANMTPGELENMTPEERQEFMEKVMEENNMTKEDMARMAITTRERVMNGSGNMTQAREKVQALREEMQQMRQEMSQNAQSAKGQSTANQNNVRLAVMSLQRMKDLLEPNMGAKVSEIAQSFNNSLKETVQAEEQIQTRSGFKRFFAGGDEVAAKRLQEQANQTQNRLQELKQLHDTCDCDEEVKAMLQEQIQQMEQEQQRVQELAEKEVSSKGLFGWIWK